MPTRLKGSRTTVAVTRPTGTRELDRRERPFAQTEVQEALTRVRPAAEPDRVLATVLFTLSQAIQVRRRVYRSRIRHDANPDNDPCDRGKDRTTLLGREKERENSYRDDPADPRGDASGSGHKYAERHGRYQPDQQPHKVGGSEALEVGTVFDPVGDPCQD